MRHAHTVEQVRAAEAALRARLPVGALMERASVGLAHAIADFVGPVYGARVLLVVGSGDNGGDALFAGAHLARRGARVEALLLLPGRAHEAGLSALHRAGGLATTDVARLRRPDVLVDGIVGIGASGGLREDARTALAGVRQRFGALPVVAVDLPSGVGVDDGTAPEDASAYVHADLTVTFGTHKACHLVEPAASACGPVQLVDLGLDTPAAPVTSLQRGDVAALLPQPDRDAHKYTRGVVGVRTGSEQYPGAAVLGVGGANTGLVGMVRYVGAAADAVRAAYPEVVVGEERVQAWVVGSGGHDDARDAVAAVRDEGVPLCLDADALAAVDGPLGVPAVLTPHAGELARMLGVDRSAVEARQLEHARLAAERYGCVVLLKGRHSLAARPDGAVRVNTAATPWLATAGAGDVLAGVVGALLAAGLEPYDASAVGAWVHGSAAALASRGGPLTAGRIATAVPEVVRRLVAPR